jgi:hypothetical protein
MRALHTTNDTGTVIGTLVTAIVYVEPDADEPLLWVKVPLGKLARQTT